jgi:hypothetical protein
MPGEGVEPSCPRRGHLILSQARLTDFATPAESGGGQDSYEPGVKLLTGNLSGPLPRNASLNAFIAFSLKRGRIIT